VNADPASPVDARAAGPTVGVLLAAGSGSRLGRGPKALLPYRGRPLVEHVARTLAVGGCERVVVVLGAGADDVQRLAVLDGCEVVVNPDWATGMGSSVRVGIAAASAAGAARVVVALVDQPGILPDDVAHLLAEHRPGRVVASGYAPALDVATGSGAEAGGGASRPGAARRRRSHPLVLETGLAVEAAATAEGDRGLRNWLAAHEELIDVVDQPGDGRDVDTEADLSLLR
jgi:nicotine blue oxidoreductase